jgi:hypothetical protein
VFALMIDSDADRGRGWNGDASLIVETSPGNRQYWYFLDEAISAGEARHVGAGMREATRTDDVTGSITQPFRVAGLLNFPNSKKRKRGRTVSATRIVAHRGELWTLDELREAFPITLRRGSVGNNDRHKSLRSMRQILDRHPGIQSSTRRKLLGPGQIGRERRHRMHWLVANELHEAGVSADEAFVCLWDTKWNKHKDQGAAGENVVWNMIDKIWIDDHVGR